MPATEKPKRIVNPRAIEAARTDFCAHCGCRVFKPGSATHELRWSHVHHIKSRGAGGDDVPENLLTLCAQDHARAHNGTLLPQRNYTIGNPPKWFAGSIDAA